MAEEDVQVVITQHALCPARFDESPNECDNGRAVRPTIGQVSEKDEPPALGMVPVLGVTKVVEKPTKGVDLAVDISHDIDGTAQQRADEGCLGHRPVLYRG